MKIKNIKFKELLGHNCNTEMKISKTFQVFDNLAMLNFNCSQVLLNV